MSQIVFDEVLRSKLGDLRVPVEMCDENGKVIARVTPVYDPDRFGPLEPQVSTDELDRRRESRKWHTTDDVLQHLRTLERQ